MPSSRTCSAPISIRWKRRAAIRRSPTSSITAHDDIAKIVGKSRSHVTNTLRLLKLPEPVKAYINAGKLTAGHARMLIGQPNAEEMAREIVERGLNVRQVEALARKSGKAAGERGQAQAARSARTPTPWRWRSGCPMRSGLLVTIDHRGNGGGMLAGPLSHSRSARRRDARLEAGPKIQADDREDIPASGPRIRRT